MSEDIGRRPGSSATDDPSPRPGRLRGERIALSQRQRFGRKRGPARLAELLGRERLVTVAGGPGVGKTTLALDVAEELAEGSPRAMTPRRATFPGGVWVVDLSEVADSTWVPWTVASALALPDLPGRSTVESIAVGIGDRDLLLVLDGCDDVSAACGQMAAVLLSSCPGLRVLATASDGLRVTGEAVQRVRPLGVPGTDARSVSRIASSESVVMLLDRAGPTGFELRAANARSVAALCRVLGGVPGAIELAAPRVDPLLAEGVQRSRAQADVPPVELVAGWIYRVLGAPERALLRRLSVFAGGSALPHAEAICPGADLFTEEIFESLARLVGSSLVVADTAGPEARYRLPRAVRRLMKERLAAAGEEHEAGERHGWWITALAEEAELHLVGPNQKAWADRLGLEAGNFRTALEWWLSEEQTLGASRLAGSLALWWRGRGAFEEGRSWTGRALGQSGSTPPAVRAKALWAAGLLGCASGEPRTSMPFLEESLAIGRALEDDVVSARALLGLGDCVRSQDREDGLRILRESAALAREARDGWCVAAALATTGYVHLAGNRPSKARSSFEDSVVVCRQTGDLVQLGDGLLRLGEILHRAGDSWSAETLLEEAIRVAQASGRRHQEASASVEVGALAGDAGDMARADRRFHGALALALDVGARGVAADALMALGRLAIGEGRWRKAAGFLDRAGSNLDAISRSGAELSCLRAQLAMARGNRDRAVALSRGALSTARGDGDDRTAARALLVAAQLARAQGSLDAAESAFRDALLAFERVGETRGVLDGLEGLAGASAARNRPFHSARLFGAAAAIRDAHRHARFLPDSPMYPGDVEILRARLLSDDLEAVWLEGGALSLQEAVALSRRSPIETKSPDDSWERLTKAERAVVGLVAEGLTNRQIGERLVISRHTVQTHLAHVFAKLGVNSRTVLAREATTRQQARRRPGARRPVGLR